MFMDFFGRYRVLVVLVGIIGSASFAEAQTSPIVVGAERLAEAAGGKASVAEGRVLYRELGCAICHDRVSGRDRKSVV